MVMPPLIGDIDPGAGLQELEAERLPFTVNEVQGFVVAVDLDRQGRPVTATVVFGEFDHRAQKDRLKASAALRHCQPACSRP